MTSLWVLFKGCGEEIHPSSSIYVVPKPTRFVKQTTDQPSQHSWVYQAIQELGKAKFQAGELIEELRTSTPKIV